jgi:hypothetical protein
MTLRRSTPTMAHSSAGMVGATIDEACRYVRGFGCKAQRLWKVALVVASSLLEGDMCIESSVSNDASPPRNTAVAAVWSSVATIR